MAAGNIVAILGLEVCECVILFYSSILFPFFSFIVLLFAVFDLYPFTLIFPPFFLYFLLFNSLYSPSLSSLLFSSHNYNSHPHMQPSLFPSSLYHLTSFSSFISLSPLLPYRVGLSNENRNPLIVMGLRTLTRYHIPGTYTTLHYTTLHYTTLDTLCWIV